MKSLSLIYLAIHEICNLAKHVSVVFRPLTWHDQICFQSELWKSLTWHWCWSSCMNYFWLRPANMIFVHWSWIIWSVYGCKNCLNDHFLFDSKSEISEFHFMIDHCLNLALCITCVQLIWQDETSHLVYSCSSWLKCSLDCKLGLMLMLCIFSQFASVTVIFAYFQCVCFPPIPCHGPVLV